MFPYSPDPSGATHSLRSAIRHAADLVIAFMTLESYGLEDLERSSAASARGNVASLTDNATARPDPSPIDRAVAGPDFPLEQREIAQELTPSWHPHRHELRPPKRSGRPGASTAREQLCLMPIQGAGAQRPARTRDHRDIRRHHGKPRASVAASGTTA